MSQPCNNGKNFRPIPFYFVNTTDESLLTQEKIDTCVKRLADQHFGGLLLFNKPPDGFSCEEYLSDKWFAMTERFVLACLKYGMELWLNDGFNFPPGDAGGRIEKVAPWLKQQVLLLDEDDQVQIREVDWGFPAFEDPESSELFIRFVYEEYRKRLGKYFGCGIKGFFSDADNRRVNHFTKDLLDGRSYFPWYRNFADIFRKACGYDIVPFLPRILKGEKGDFSRDYWHVAGMVYQQWFANNYKWCEANGLEYTFHTSDTGPFTMEAMPRSSIYTEGNIFELMAYSHCPGTDHELLRLDGGTHYDSRYYIPESPYGQEYAAKKDFAVTVDDVRAKYVSSAAYYHRRERVLCEAYAATNWGVSFNELRRITSWQIMQGINFFVPHAVHHVPGGDVKFFAPPEFSRSPLAAGVVQFNDFTARFCAEASSGEYVAPIAVIDPVFDIWQGRDTGRRLFEICDRLNRQGWGYHIVPRDAAGTYEWVFDPAADAGSDPVLPPAPVQFNGNGDLHFMLRREADGRLKVLAANIWSDAAVSGTIRFCGLEYPVNIPSGGIEILLEGDAPQSDAAAHKESAAAENVDVELLDRQIIPLRDLRCWKVQDGVGELSLLVPERWAGNVVVNGTQLPWTGDEISVSGDRCRVFALPAAAGEYALTFPDGEPLKEYPVYLTGDITAEVTVPADEKEVFIYQYNVNLLSAASAHLVIAPGRKPRPGLLREQGYPFYSGRVRYTLKYPVQGESLYFARSGHTLKVFIAGKEAATVIFDGTYLPLPADWDRTVEIVQYNSLGNQLEGAAYENGLAEFPVCIVR